MLLFKQQLFQDPHPDIPFTQKPISDLDLWPITLTSSNSTQGTITTNVCSWFESNRSSAFWVSYWLSLMAFLFRHLGPCKPCNHTPPPTHTHTHTLSSYIMIILSFKLNLQLSQKGWRNSQYILSNIKSILAIYTKPLAWFRIVWCHTTCCHAMACHTISYHIALVTQETIIIQGTFKNHTIAGEWHNETYCDICVGANEPRMATSKCHLPRPFQVDLWELTKISAMSLAKHTACLFLMILLMT